MLRRLLHNAITRGTRLQRTRLRVIPRDISCGGAPQRLSGHVSPHRLCERDFWSHTRSSDGWNPTNSPSRRCPTHGAIPAAISRSGIRFDALLGGTTGSSGSFTTAAPCRLDTTFTTLTVTGPTMTQGTWSHSIVYLTPELVAVPRCEAAGGGSAALTARVSCRLTLETGTYASGPGTWIMPAVASVTGYEWLVAPDRNRCSPEGPRCSWSAGPWTGRTVSGAIR